MIHCRSLLQHEATEHRPTCCGSTTWAAPFASVTSSQTLATFAGDPESKEDVEADTSGDETDPVDPGHKARDEMFAAVASIRVGY